MLQWYCGPCLAPFFSPVSGLRWLRADRDARQWKVKEPSRKDVTVRWKETKTHRWPKMGCGDTGHVCVCAQAEAIPLPPSPPAILYSQPLRAISKPQSLCHPQEHRYTHTHTCDVSLEMPRSKVSPTTAPCSPDVTKTLFLNIFPRRAEEATVGVEGEGE